MLVSLHQWKELKSSTENKTLCFFWLQAEHRTMAVFILAVIVNSYNTGQVCVCAHACLDMYVYPHCCPFDCQKPKEEMLPYYSFTSFTRTLGGLFWAKPSLWEIPLWLIVYFREMLVVWQFWHQQSPLQYPSLSQPPAWWHFIITHVTSALLLASGVQSQKPLLSDAHQTSKDAMLGWCSLSFHGVHTHTHSYGGPKLPI